MNTRQGGRKTPDEPDDCPGSTMADLQGAQASGPQDKMEEIAGMMKSLMSSQYTRDKMVEKERTRQEQRWNAMQDQVQELQQQLMRMQTECSAHPEPTSRPATAQTEQRRGRTTPVLVNGHCAEALLDSGCFQTVVRSSLVPLERQSPEKARLICIHGDEHNYPTGEVYLTEPSQQFLVRAVKDEEITEKFFPVPPKEPAAIDLSHLSPPQQDEIKTFLEPRCFWGGTRSSPPPGEGWGTKACCLPESAAAGPGDSLLGSEEGMFGDEVGD
uniref:Uncharacterized protein n=1 Tax=Knipowitschia caucasica TaxID=637954 RepID=A0AAV2KNR8_KNICA